MTTGIKTMSQTLKRTFLILLLLSGAVLGPVACGGGEPETPETDPRTRGEPLTVAVETATYRPLGARSVVTGAVEPSRRSMPGSKIMGRVARVPVEEGERVRAGDLLAALESRDLQAAVRQAEAAVAGAEARLANAEAQYERITRLQAKGSATEKSLEDATSGFRTAEAGLAQAEASLEAARVTLGYAEIRAPFDGWVVDKRAEAGTMVQPGAPLFTIEDLDPVKVIAEVPETEVSGKGPGDPVTVEVSSVGYWAEGEIVRLVPAGDPRSRTFRIEIAQPNPEGVLMSGLFARVTLDEEGERTALLVPGTAMVSRGQLDGVFVAEEARTDAEGGAAPFVARLRWVRLGDRRGDRVEVTSGLDEGELYLVDPPTGLVDGVPLRVERVETSVGLSGEPPAEGER